MLATGQQQHGLAGAHRFLGCEGHVGVARDLDACHGGQPRRGQQAAMAVLKGIEQLLAGGGGQVVVPAGFLRGRGHCAAWQVAPQHGHPGAHGGHGHGFYSMYELKPVGRHSVSVCTNISCMLRGGDAVLAHIERKLGIKLGESTPDGKFYLKREEECLAACCGAPMMQVDHVYYEHLTPEKVDQVLDSLE